MRTTIEIKPEHRARLIEIAARRGEKGFSSVVAEAIDSYLGHNSAMEKRRKKALALRGSISADEAELLYRTTARIRESWR